MIQRKQTLFLFQSVFLGIAMLFVPCAHIEATGASIPVYLVKISAQGFASSMGHTAAILLNFLNIVLASLTVFLYKNRELQIKLTYITLVIWLILAGMTAFCPFVNSEVEFSVRINYFAPLICLVGAAAAWFAARNIKKDIDLLKSADRIR